MADEKSAAQRDPELFRRIVAAQEKVRAAEVELTDAVRAAREAGDSWTMIGYALDTNRQTAFRRYRDTADVATAGGSGSRSSRTRTGAAKRPGATRRRSRRG